MLTAQINGEANGGISTQLAGSASFGGMGL